MTPEQLTVWTGQGPVYFGKYNPSEGAAASGFMVGLYPVGCGTPTLTTSLSVEKTTLKETCSGARSTLVEKITARNLEVSLGLQQFAPRTLARALFGESVLQSAGSVTDEALPKLSAGDVFVLQHPDVTNVQLRAGSTDLVQDTDWEIIDARHGTGRLLVDAGTEPILATYNYGEYVNIPAMTSTNIETGILFAGINDDGVRARIMIPRVSLALNGAINWISEEATTLEFSGSALFVPELQSDAIYGGLMRVSMI
ncbi:MAG: hypothetical protein IK051_01285 [Rhodocyclaceae bacterium]|nr:hypothetical protein [Rhodocyclaceae bacterium]